MGEYFHEKINYALFNKIICAFKVNGERIELNRTTHEKTMSDFIRCTKLPENTQICYLDDMYYPEMANDNVYYIKVNPYVYNLSFDDMISRFISSDIGKKAFETEEEIHTFIEFSYMFFKTFKYVYSEKSKEEYEIDKIVSKKTMILLQDFFKKSFKNNTIKNLKYIKTKTKKNTGF